MKGNMKKKLIIGSLALSLFGTGALTGGAASSWKQQVINEGQVRIGKAASNKKDELLANVDAKIQEKMMEGMEEKISSREAEAERLLEEYFNQKVSELGNTEETAEIEEAFDLKLENIVGMYKEQIDAAFGTVY